MAFTKAWVAAAVILAGCGDNIHPSDGNVVITPATGLVTTEAGGQATFMVALDSKPRFDVSIALASSNTAEGTVSPVSIAFTSDDFNAPQPVYVTGVQDDVADGTQPYLIVVAPAASEDSRFNGIHGDDIHVENVDDDTASFTVTPLTGLTTSESGRTAEFSIVLNSKPSANVTVGLSSSDAGEGTVSPSDLTFTVDNWNAPQFVTITGVNDDLEDGAQDYQIVTAPATSDDTGYAGLDPNDVSVTNIDNDTAGITVEPLANLVTTEDLDQATFTVVLNAQPTANVTIPIHSADPTEGTPDVVSLTFTPVNWNAPQPVTVTGVDDAIADGDQPYTVEVQAATSSDSHYSGLDGADVALTNTDNDSAGVRLSKTTGLVTTENRDQDTFTIVLNSQPTADVRIDLTSSDPGEGTVSPSSVTFTPANWDAPQTVTLTGVNDDIADGDQPYQIVTHPAVSADSGYNNFDAANASATNIDNDSAGFIVAPTSGLITSEAHDQASFTVKLTSQPTADVTIPISSSAPGEGTPSPTSLTFTPLNWDAPQTVTVTGEDDAVADGDQVYLIVTGAATSADAGYAGKNPDDVSVTNNDNDTAGITVRQPTNPIVTGEQNAQQATFTIVLDSQPTASVTIPLMSSDPTEGSLSVSSVTFTTLNWSAPQTITVTGVDDFVADGDQVYSIVTGPATSADSAYMNRNAADVPAKNLDDDSPGIIVNAAPNLTTGESGTPTATFTIVLKSQPSAPVTIGLTTSDPTEGVPNLSSVTFTTLNWSAPQTITVTGQDDAVADGNQVYKIVTAAATSADSQYDTLDAADVTLTNLDDDTAGVIVGPLSLTTNESGTSPASFSIVLQSQPTADVTISVTSLDPSEGTVSPTSVTFTTVNWAAPQVITVTGVDDNVADGNQVYFVTVAPAVSADPKYLNQDGADVQVTNIDNDSPGILVSPTSGLTTTESLGKASFTVKLASQPAADVTIPLHSSDLSEGTIAVTSLTFTPANWNAEQTVEITGADDSIADGNQPYTIVLDTSTSADPGYNIDGNDVSVTNIDNDSANVIVSPITSPTSRLTTTEAGPGSDFFTVVLSAQPTADVTITFTSTDPTEGMLPITSITFTSANWNQQQTVTVTGVDDAITDGNQPYRVTSVVSSADSAFNNLPVADVYVTNNDNDIPGFTVDPTSGLITSEFGVIDADTFTIVLNTQPTADVTIPLSSSDTTEATVATVNGCTPAPCVRFTAANWNVPQTVTVTGADDNLADGDQTYTIVTGLAVSGDPLYSGLNPPDVSGVNFDNDTAAVFIRAKRKNFTRESGGPKVNIRVLLTTQPSADVTCTFQSSDTTEGVISPTTLTFTPQNYATAQTITVDGVDDLIKDGDQLYTIVSFPCTSSDTAYNGKDPRDVSVINRDND